MATLLAAASSSVKLLVGQGEPSIDNWTFRLFYQWTTGLLLASSVIVTSNQFFGTPIECDLVSLVKYSDTSANYCLILI